MLCLPFHPECSLVPCLASFRLACMSVCSLLLVRRGHLGKLSGELPPHGRRSFRLALPTHPTPVPFPHSFFSFRGDVLAVAVWPDAIPRLKADPPGSYSRHMRSERRQRAQRPSLRSGFRHVADSKQRSDQRERHEKKKTFCAFSWIVRPNFIRPGVVDTKSGVCVPTKHISAVISLLSRCCCHFTFHMWHIYIFFATR